MTIAVLCPTRDRPTQFRRMMNSCNATSRNAIVIAGTNGEKSDYVGRKYPLDVPTVFMWNDLASIAARMPEVKLFMIGSDDTIFSTPHWDVALLDHYNVLENKIHVYHLQDSRDPSGTPHPIVTREWIETMGYAFPPIFLHWHLDTWTVEIAKANNCFTHMKDYLLIHDKPSDKGQADETHNRIRRKGWHERDAYVAETCKHFLEFEKQRLAKVMV